jgi:metal-responsive CopG/Arc/MetJ family transcriptional regulator
MKPEKQYVSVFFDKAMLERIDVYRFDNRFPSRTEAIRHLIELGLQSAVATAPAPKGKALRRAW